MYLPSMLICLGLRLVSLILTLSLCSLRPVFSLKAWAATGLTGETTSAGLGLGGFCAAFLSAFIFSSCSRSRYDISLTSSSRADRLSSLFSTSCESPCGRREDMKGKSLVLMNQFSSPAPYNPFLSYGPITLVSWWSANESTEMNFTRERLPSSGKIHGLRSSNWSFIITCEYFIIQVIIVIEF